MKDECAHCGELSISLMKTKYERVCSDCFVTSYTRCEICNEYVTDTAATKEDHEVICNECKKKEEHNVSNTEYVQ